MLNDQVNIMAFGCLSNLFKARVSPVNLAGDIIAMVAQLVDNCFQAGFKFLNILLANIDFVFCETGVAFMQVFFESATNQDELGFGFVRDKLERFFDFNRKYIGTLAKILVNVKYYQNLVLRAHGAPPMYSLAQSKLYCLHLIQGCYRPGF